MGSSSIGPTSLWKGEVWTQRHTPTEERWRKKTGSRDSLLQDKEKDVRQLLPPQPSGDNLINSTWTCLLWNWRSWTNLDTNHSLSGILLQGISPMTSWYPVRERTMTAWIEYKMVLVGSLGLLPHMRSLHAPRTGDHRHLHCRLHPVSMVMETVTPVPCGLS